MWYNIFGSINTVFIIMSLYGIYAQLNKVWLRSRNGEKHPTDVLSQNQFTVSFLAYFSFFVYGYSIEPFNHYIVWPRLAASLMVAAILFEMWKERRSLAALSSLILVSVSFMLGGVGLVLNETRYDESKNISTILILAVTVFLAQGYFHQIKLILKSGHTGAIDIRMSQFILLMDISTIAFSCAMGLKEGWPLLTLACVSGVTKLVIMYLFHWVKVSLTAKLRRSESYQLS
jgi:hypothetical protein